MTDAQVRVVLNRFRRPGVIEAPSRAPVRAFHRTLPGYAATPLVSRPALAVALGLGGLYVKYEAPRFGLGAFKGLGASWALHRLQTERSAPLGTVSAASAGNHGRAVAWAARLAGLPCVIFLPSGATPAQVDAIRGEGARVELVEGSYEDTVQHCARVSQAQGWQVISDVGYPGYLEIPPLVVEGYSTVFAEIDEQLAQAGWREPDAVLIPAGVGGILHAGVEHYRRRARPPRIIGVEPVAGDCLSASLQSDDGAPAVSAGNGKTTMSYLNCAEVSLSSWPAIRDGIDAMVGVDDAVAEQGMRLLFAAARGEISLEAGSSGASTTGALAALAAGGVDPALRERLGLGPDRTVLVVCTQGAIDQAHFRRVVGSG